MRVRKNAAEMADAEWTRFCNALVALKHTYAAGSTVSIYDQFVAVHLAVDHLVKAEEPTVRRPDAAYGGPAFLPWHREYLRRLEVALASVDPHVTLPYWNWGVGAEEKETDKLFTDNRLGIRARRISTGYFSEHGHRDVGLAWTMPEALREVFRLTPAVQRGTQASLTSELPSTLLSILLCDRFSIFTKEMQAIAGFPPSSEGVPGAVHAWIGGDMATRRSPIDPIFFLHYAQVDRIWAIWQREHPGEADYPKREGDEDDIGFGHALDDYMWPWDGGASTLTQSEAALKRFLPTLPANDRVRPRDVLDTRKRGYIYDGEDAPREFARTEEDTTHEWRAVDLQTGYGRAPVVVAGMQTCNGTDTAVVRIRNARDSRVEFMVQEEQSCDAEVAHVAESIGYLAGEEGLLYDVSGRVIGELGNFRLGQGTREEWERFFFVFKGGFEFPVLVTTIRTHNGLQTAHMRLSNVGNDGFEAAIEEWAYQDGWHWIEDVSYLVVNEGDHRLPDGTRIAAARPAATHEWQTVEFSFPFADKPVVLSHCMTTTGSDPVVTRQRHVQEGSFEVCLQEEEARAGSGHIQETVGYIALGR